jgi:hypothetical protein
MWSFVNVLPEKSHEFAASTNCVRHRNQSGAVLEAARSRTMEPIHNHGADEPRKNDCESRLADDRGKEVVKSMRSGRPIGGQLCTADSLCQVELSRYLPLRHTDENKLT